jgi:hypothetical protein
MECVHSEFLSFLNDASLDVRTLERLKRTISRTADAWTEGSRMLSEKRAQEIRRIKDQQRQLIRMKMDQLITDEEFTGQRSTLVSRLGELEGQQDEYAVDAEAVIGNIDRICAPLMDLGTAWRSVAVDFQRRFQLLALPVGYMFGRVGTAQRGRLFSLLGPSVGSNSSLVALTGQSWNQLANEIKTFEEIFRECS